MIWKSYLRILARVVTSQDAGVTKLRRLPVVLLAVLVLLLAVVLLARIVYFVPIVDVVLCPVLVEQGVNAGEISFIHK